MSQTQDPKVIEKPRQKAYNNPTTSGLSKYIHPGTNFYGYVNATWHDKANIEEFDYSTGVSEEIERRIDKQLQKLFIQFMDEKSKDPYHQAIGTLYKSALHYRDESESLELVKDMISRIQGIQTKEEVGTILGEFARYNIEGFFNLYGSYVLENKKQYTFTFSTGSLGLHESYYQKSTLERKKHFKDYKLFVQTLGNLFNIPQLHCIIPFEKILAKSILDSEEDQIRKKGSALESHYNAIPWEEFFNAFGLSSWKQELFYIESPVWMDTLQTLFKELEIDFWKIYLSYQLILHSLPYLPNPYSYQYYFFYKKQLKGQPERMSASLFATFIVEAWLTPLVNQMYIEHFFTKEKKDHVITLCDELIAAAIEQLENNSWLKKKTIEKAIEKVKKMKHFVGYPHSFKKVNVPALEDKNLLRNILTLGEWQVSQDLKKIGSTMPEHEVFNDAIFAVNAYYYGDSNQMVIPAGTIQDPFFNEHRPQGWNYGGLGCIIGHEMTHAFDEDGKDINPEGVEKTWWSKEDIKAYDEKTKDLIRLFNNQKIVPVKISGKKTLDENIADLGGMSIALIALQNKLHAICASEKEKKEAYKQFFISYAVSWRYKDRKQKRFQALFMDVHSSSILRVNLIVSQFQEWYETFGVKEKDLLYIPPEKRISIF